MSDSKISTADIHIELQQFLVAFCQELDRGGLNLTRFYFADGVFMVGDRALKGHDGVSSFYADREERVRTLQKDGIRTARHTFTNLQISVGDQDHATLNFLNLTYAGEGAPPVQGLVGPSGISDCRRVCERDTDGEWRLKLFDGAAVFLGNDSFVNKIALNK